MNPNEVTLKNLVHEWLIFYGKCSRYIFQSPGSYGNVMESRRHTFFLAHVSFVRSIQAPHSIIHGILQPIDLPSKKSTFSMMHVNICIIQIYNVQGGPLLSHNPYTSSYNPT